MLLCVCMYVGVCVRVFYEADVDFLLFMAMGSPHKCLMQVTLPARVCLCVCVCMCVFVFVCIMFVHIGICKVGTQQPMLSLNRNNEPSLQMGVFFV